MRVFYNHDMTSIATNVTPTHNYDMPITKAHVQSFVYDIADTDVDTFTCCPTFLRQPLWPSKVMPHWTEEAPFVKEPEIAHDWKFFEYAYFRFRRYILSGGDPVGDTVEAAKKCGKKIFFSYRMNDIHMFIRNPESPNIDSFWKAHPEYRIGESVNAPTLRDRRTAAMMQDYLKPEIRQHYLSVLEELTQMYDIDGLEFDFMRAPCYFSPDHMEEGTRAMTQFVRDVRSMLDRFGAERGKRLELSARMPNTPEKALSIGLDVAVWEQEHLVDFININSNTMNATVNLDIEGYKALAPSMQILAELQYMIAPMKKIGNYGRRYATREQLKTFAQNLLERKADGLAVYNFTFYRRSDFNDPRRGMYRGTEPPFDVFKGITDLDALRSLPKHYYWGRDVLYNVPLYRRAELTFDTYDDTKGAANAVLRIETDEMCHGLQMDVFLNGTQLKEFVDTGELYRPLTIEALPINEQIRFFEVPLSLLRMCKNELTAECFGSPMRDITFIGVELAIYR